LTKEKQPFKAVIFDLLTALLDSWSLWNRVAGAESTGLRWRNRYLELTYQAGRYQPYEELIAASARDTGVAASVVQQLISRWSEIKPWPECTAVLKQLSTQLPLAVATNSSRELAKIALACTGNSIPVMITAQDAGYYKPRPEVYQMALSELALDAGDVLFVAGSMTDIPGATAVGMSVYWHNRMKLQQPEFSSPPDYETDSLAALPDIVQAGPQTPHVDS